MSDITDRVLSNCLIRLPGAVAGAVWLTAFDVVDDLKRNYLQQLPPVSAVPDNWLDQTQWGEHYRLVIDGTVARMAAELGKPYSNAQLAQAHLAMYAGALAAVRPHGITDSLGYPDRAIQTIQVRVPQARDTEIRARLFDTIDELRRDTLDTVGPNPALTPDGWLSTDQWAEYFRLVTEGAVARLKAQTGQPTFDEAGAALAQSRWMGELARVRANLLKNASTTYLDRLIANARARVPLARLGQIQEALFETVDELTRNGLEITPPANAGGSTTGSTGGTNTGNYLPVTNPDGSISYIPQTPSGSGSTNTSSAIAGTPGQWLPDGLYAIHYRLLLNGVCFHLLSDTGAPYADPERAKLFQSEYQSGLARVRSDVTAAASQTYFARAIENVRLRCPQARTPYIERKMFDVIDVLCQDVLQVPRPPGAADPSAWIPENIWQEHFKLIVEGTVAAILPGDPASASFATMLQRVRANGATGVAATAYDRVMQNIRVHIGPAARDGVIGMELYNTVDEVCREALYRDPPQNTSDPRTWMTDPEYARYLRLLVSGTLMRLHAQTQPYADATQVSIHAQTYAREMVTARTDATGGPNANLMTQLFDTVRLQCQGIKDATITLEYFNAAIEFCQLSKAWRRTILIPTAIGQTRYAFVPPAGTSVIDVLEIGHQTLPASKSDWFFDRQRGEIALANGAPTAADIAHPLFVRLVLQPEPQQQGDIIPVDLVRQFYRPVLDGLLMRLYKLPGRPWTNPVNAAYHGRRASNETGLARARVREQAAGTSRLRFPIFARG